MQQLLVALICGVLVAPPAPATYSVTVTRKERNLYRIDGTKTYIKTKLCLELAIMAPAILKYERTSLNNILVFEENKAVCDVEALLKDD